MDWTTYYPAFIESEKASQTSLKDCGNTPQAVNTENARRLKRDIEIADIGCGFGGLLMALSPRFPDKLLIGK